MVALHQLLGGGPLACGTDPSDPASIGAGADPPEEDFAIIPVPGLACRRPLIVTDSLWLSEERPFVLVGFPWFIMVERTAGQLL